MTQMNDSPLCRLHISDYIFYSFIFQIAFSRQHFLNQLCRFHFTDCACILPFAHCTLKDTYWRLYFADCSLQLALLELLLKLKNLVMNKLTKNHCSGTFERKNVSKSGKYQRGGSALKIKKSKIQNVDFLRGERYSDFSQMQMQTLIVSVDQKINEF